MSTNYFLLKLQEAKQSPVQPGNDLKLSYFENLVIQDFWKSRNETALNGNQPTRLRNVISKGFMVTAFWIFIAPIIGMLYYTIFEYYFFDPGVSSVTDQLLIIGSYVVVLTDVVYYFRRSVKKYFGWATGYDEFLAGL